MLDIISSIKEFFGTIFDVVRGFALVFVNLLSIVQKAGNFIVTVIGHLPVYFTIPLGVLVIVAILYKILGREGQD